MLKLRTIILAVGSLIAAASAADAQSHYDYRTGNSYSVHRGSSGTTIYGSNAQTGSTWQQRQNSNGTYSGQDADGNSYLGNNNTGFYQNLGTGRICTGQGYARVCN